MPVASQVPERLKTQDVKKSGKKRKKKKKKIQNWAETKAMVKSFTKADITVFCSCP